jgi:TRAP-type mannitol/chloroaromatic compound transport system permease small subunit
MRNLSYNTQMKSFIKTIDNLNEKIGTAVSWLTIVLVLITCYDVTVRYVFEESSAAFQEIEWHLFAIIFLASAAYTLKIEGHVRVDLFYSKFSIRNKALVDFIGSVLFLIPFSLLVIWSSKNFVINSFIMKETSPDAGGLPARYILKAFIPISFFLLFLQGVALTLKSYLTLKAKNKLTETNG